MYETVTYEEIMTRMLDRVRTEYPSVDTREGSLVYTAIAPCALELAIMYTELDRVLEEVFAETASLEYLEKRTAERGITQRLASHAIMKAEFKVLIPNLKIAIGTEFSLGDFNYTLIDSENGYLQCTTAGSEPNTIFGTAEPHVPINGLESVTITDCVIPGEDDEDVEELRSRYFDSLGVQSYGFNAKQYREVVNDMDGVGATRVIPAHKGGGTVGLIILDSNFSTPTPELVATVQEAIDPLENTGKGLGLAPIGHMVEVSAATELPINIECTFDYKATYDWDVVKEDVYKAIDTHFATLSKEWETGSIIVRLSHIMNALLDVIGIEDVRNITINGSASNIQIENNDIPVRGTINGNS